MKRLIALFIFLVSALPAFAQSVTLPAEVKGGAGSWVIVAPEKVDGGTVKWRIDPGLQDVRLDLLLPPEMLVKLKGKVVTGQPGRYKIEAWCAKGDVASDIATCWVVIGGPSPVPPGPTPDPPKPEPIPVVPAFRVLIVEETADRAKLPHGQLAAIFSKQIRDYLEAKCIVEKNDKINWKSYRIYDKDTPIAHDLPWVQTAMAKRPQSTPWIMISTGTAEGQPVWVHSGPLPASVDEVMTLLKRFGG